mgnify:CR=1 FL=1
MSKEPGPIERGMRSLIEHYSPLPAEVLEVAEADCRARRDDAVAGLAVLEAARKTDCGCSDDSYFCRQPGCPRAEILGIFEAKPSLADLVDMFPDDEPVSQARAS